MESCFVTGIGTGIGKTIFSAILAQRLGADYWKPVQCGSLEHTDTMMVQSLVSHPDSKFHPEKYLLKKPASPHDAAEEEGRRLVLGEICLPKTPNCIVIEGAGGILVPLNENELMIDLIKKFESKVIVVCSNYLGSINHSLMTFRVLENAGMKASGLVFMGEANPKSEEIIQKISRVKCIGKIPWVKSIDQEFVQKSAETLNLDVIL